MKQASGDNHVVAPLGIGPTVLLLFSMLLLGCQRPSSISTEYGKSSTKAGVTSINGTSILAEMFRRRGKTVRRAVSISPVLKRYDVVVWFPDSTDAPSQKEVDALTKWLTEESGRTLVYVGRSYDAELDYLQQIGGQIVQEKQEEYQRTLAEARVRVIKETTGDGRFIPFTFWGVETNDSCDWFSIQSIPPKTVDQLSGPLAESVEADRVEIRPTTQLVIDEEEFDSVSVWLSTNDIPFVSSIEIDAGWYSYATSQIVVVNDGSFLLNYGLVNPEHRKLANNLIDQIGNFSKVVCLESGPGPCPVRDRVEQHQPWSWIAEPPIRYVIPHVLFWGVLFCFAMYPIFGRPRKFKPKPLHDGEVEALSESAQQPSLYSVDSMSSFRSHIVAMGKLYQRTEKPEEAAEKVKLFQRSQIGELADKKEK